MSAHLDGELPGLEARAVAAHLAECGPCGKRWLSLRRSLELLSELPRLDSVEGIASRVRDRLEVESRGPGLALLFRPKWAARPLILPSLVPAFVVLVAVLAGAMALDHDSSAMPLATVGARTEPWDGRMPPSGTEGNPLFPSSEVSVPRSQARDLFPEQLLTAMDEGTFFFETVVARDGRVSDVNLIGGDSVKAAPFMDALRRERFEPGRFRGRPVAVSLYWLISSMDVHAAI
jgi:hypothetical protein